MSLSGTKKSLEKKARTKSQEVLVRILACVWGIKRLLTVFWFCFFWNDMIRFTIQSFGCRVGNLMGKVDFPKRWP